MDGELDDGLNPSGSGAGDPFGEQAHAALAEATSWVGGEVHGVGLGRTEDGAPCVVAYVGAAAPDLPTEVRGVPVRVVDSGPIQALAEPEADGPV